MRNSIYITTLPILEIRKNLSFMAFLSDVEESAQKITTVKKKKEKYTAN